VKKEQIGIVLKAVIALDPSVDPPVGEYAPALILVPVSRIVDPGTAGVGDPGEGIWIGPASYRTGWMSMARAVQFATLDDALEYRPADPLICMALRTMKAFPDRLHRGELISIPGVDGHYVWGQWMYLGCSGADGYLNHFPAFDGWGNPLLKRSPSLARYLRVQDAYRHVQQQANGEQD
jgi:hypothetical protein